MALIAAIPLLTKAVGTSVTSVTAAVIFLLSLVALYSASTIYHSVVVPKRTLRYFQKADHMMIFVLIAGTYTPIWEKSWPSMFRCSWPWKADSLPL